MPQPRASKVNDPELRAHIRELRERNGTLNRAEIARQFGVGIGTVQAARQIVDAELAAAHGKTVEEFTGGRLVRDFNGRKLYYQRRYKSYLMQELLANYAKVSRGEVGHLERLLRKPTLRTLVSLAEALGISPGDLTGKFAEQPQELIDEGETRIYDPLHPVPLEMLREPDERRQTA